MPTSLQNQLEWFIDEFSYYRGLLTIRGWAFHRSSPITEFGCLLPGRSYETLEGYALPSPDVETVYGNAAKNCRFSCSLPFNQPERGSDVRLAFTLAIDNKRLVVTDLVEHILPADRVYQLTDDFFKALASQPKGRVLEIGARNRTGVLKRARVPTSWDCVGLDVAEDSNVDVVGDAHALSDVFPPGSFDAVFAMAVFEHLIMPWKAVIEINHVLRPGGLVMIVTHQSFPLHEEPWDYFRFSSHAWRALFNPATGFEILRSEHGKPASIVAHHLIPHTAALAEQPAFIHSGVLARKISKTALRWDVSREDIEPAPPVA